ncbi:MAG TPA: hypothetical protein VGD66_11750, partial [Allosphingosinicella sp.]
MGGGLVLAPDEDAQARAAVPRSAVVFSRTPAELVAQARWLGGEEPPPCAVFDVRVLALSGPAYLATRSLGEARLALVENGTCPPAADPRWSPHVPLAPAPGIHRVALRVASEPSRADERGGEIVAFDATGEIALAKVIVRREPVMRIWPEVKWFVGFILPALIAFLFAQRAARSTERRRERNNLAVFRTAEKEKVDALFRDVKIVIAGDGFREAGAQVLQTLRTQQIIPALPIDDAETLVRLCEKNDLTGIARLLRRLFPQHADQLAKAAPRRAKP